MTIGLSALATAALLATGLVAGEELLPGDEARAAVRIDVPAKAPAQTAAKKATFTKRDVMVIGSNWGGTAQVVDARSYQVLKQIDMVPDKAQEMRDIYTNPLKLALYLAIQQVVGEGHDQLVDDLFTTPDGNLIAVSRPSLGDVVWIDLATNKIVAEQEMEGFRTDHMQVSPDGKRLLVSDSTKKKVHEYVLGGRGIAETGKHLRTFPSGETPHESNYIDRGRKIVHASIGRVYTPLDAGELGPLGDLIKADRWLQVVRNSDFKILQRWDMGKELKEAGYPHMSSAVRPMAISKDERYIFLQVSFFHGIVVFDTQAPDLNNKVDYTLGGVPEPRTGRVLRLVDLPIAPAVRKMPREKYVLDSAHHGMAINKRGTKLCVAGTMSDYGAIVRIGGLKTGAWKQKIFPVGLKPYWATTSPYSNTCWMSMSGTDEAIVYSYAKEKVIAKIPTGDHPQRIREGHVSKRVQKAWAR
ncbi:YncE family protein [Nocardioides daejeonensis]|uniref:YncE family protein n=1 Tax=Nocardioides daejeonensis TaxID=1046556 RepID=UPI001EF644FD|nr:serine/threonine protein kinase [Nocardioides daejeonensis]